MRCPVGAVAGFIVIGTAVEPYLRLLVLTLRLKRNFVASLVNGVPHNRYKGYRNLSDARRSFYELKARGLITVQREDGEEDTFGPLETAVDIP